MSKQPRTMELTIRILLLELELWLATTLSASKAREVVVFLNSRKEASI